MTYQDRLHIPSEQLTVYWDGAPAILLNKALLDQQNCWNNLENIKEAHEFKLAIYSLIKETDDIEMLRSLAEDLTELEFHLQRLWGFPEDANYHVFWAYPKCRCPSMDNRDNYPYQQIKSQDCPLHGWFE